MEMKKKVYALSFVFLLLFYKSLFATTTIDFDNINSLQVIDTYYSDMGVIFSTSGEADYSDGHAYARQSSRSKSGSNVIGGNKSRYPYLNDTHLIGIAEFLQPANKVEIWGTPRSDELLSAWMKVYDSSGTLLNTITVTGSNPGEGALLSISWPEWEIARAEFSGANKRVAFDNFSFNVAPEPISSLLFITGGTTLVARRLWKSLKR
jgi:hypothetical protein